MKNQKNSMMPILIIGALFFIFGFITWLNGVLIPYLKIACELNHFESYLVVFAFYISYFIMAIPSSFVLQKSGFKKGMMIGLMIMAFGAVLFIPAAMTRTYWMFLCGLFVLGTGLALLQTAANPYVTIVGPIESAAKRISIMGVSNKIAGVLAPLLLSYFIMKDGDAVQDTLASLSEAAKVPFLDELASRVIIPYVFIAVSLLILAVLIKFSSLPDIDEEEDEEHKQDHDRIFNYPYLFLGVIALFLYVGVEVLAADTIISYGLWNKIPFNSAKFFTSVTLSGMIIGYFIGIASIPKYISQNKALMISAISGLLFSTMAIVTTSWTSVSFIALLGLSNAIMWPAIWPLAIGGLGKYTKLGSSFLIMAVAGGAVMPLIYGMLSDAFNPQLAYLINIPCYLFILYFAVSGYKVGRKV